MIFIKKMNEPSKLIEYRNEPGARFDDLKTSVKDPLRDSLLKEQGHLCAYCMRRINGPGDVKIEHLAARNMENELQYHNLLAVCMGGENGPNAARSCDTKKGNKPISLSPLNATDMKRIYYKNNGSIHSLDCMEQVVEYFDKTGKAYKVSTNPDRDLVECLNLNYENGVPMIGRKTALKQFQAKLQPYKDRNSKRNFLIKMQQLYLQQSDKMEPYVGILRWYIEKKLAQLSA